MDQDNSEEPEREKENADGFVWIVMKLIASRIVVDACAAASDGVTIIIISYVFDPCSIGVCCVLVMF